MAKPTRRFVPRLEAFDDRILPAVTVDLVGTTLLITGKAQAEQVQILDNGTNAAGNVHVFVNGVEQTYAIDPNNGETGAIGEIRVSMGGGADQVTYNLTADLGVSRSLNVDLGSKNDIFTANIGGHNQLGGTDFLINVVGGAGDDELTINANGFSVNGTDADSPALSPTTTAQARFALFGGKGNDHLSVNAASWYVGKNSDLTLDLFGEAGTDQISWVPPSVYQESPPNPFTNGTFTVNHD